MQDAPFGRGKLAADERAVTYSVGQRVLETAGWLPPLYPVSVRYQLFGNGQFYHIRIRICQLFPYNNNYTDTGKPYEQISPAKHCPKCWREGCRNMVNFPVSVQSYRCGKAVQYVFSVAWAVYWNLFYLKI